MLRIKRWSVLIALLAGLFSHSGLAQDETQQGSPDPSAMIDFARDIQPIFEEKCLKCHGPDDAKNDFRIDQLDSVSSYVEAGDLESSSMWTDYLLTDDSDMLMPPATADTRGGLAGGQLAVIKLWIEEGAKWDWQTQASASDATDSVEAPADPGTASLPARVWTFQGLFHPASVHFPLALLMVSGLFALLSFFNRASFEPVAFHCLWIGALGAIVASIMGWSYAVHEGYGTGFSFDLRGSAIDRHRWLGIAVAVVAVMLIPLARNACRTGSFKNRLAWCLGAALLAMAVSLVGYQGGELTYGEDHYLKEYERLFPDSAKAAAIATGDSASAAEVPADSGAPADESPQDELSPAALPQTESTLDAALPDAALLETPVEAVDGGGDGGAKGLVEENQPTATPPSEQTPAAIE